MPRRYSITVPLIEVGLPCNITQPESVWLEPSTKKELPTPDYDLTGNQGLYSCNMLNDVSKSSMTSIGEAHAITTPASDEPGTSKWLIVAAASAVLLVATGYIKTFGVFQQYYQAKYFPNEPTDKLIVIGSVASSLYLILGAFTGAFADYFGYQVSPTLGSVLMVCAMFAASVSTQAWHFLLSQGFMFSLGSAFVYMPATSISSQYFEGRMHGFANGIIVSGEALGGTFLPYTIRVLLSKCG